MWPSSRTGQGIVVYENRNGTFGLLAKQDLDTSLITCPLDAVRPEAALIAGHRGTHWLDVDHDGDLDAVMLRPTTLCPDPPILYESRYAQGESGFRPQLFAVRWPNREITAVTSGDLDGDGDLDLAHTSWGTSSYGVFRNNLMENRGTEVGPAGGYVRVRALTDSDGDATDPDQGDDRDAIGILIELDLDGPADNPDFALGRGKLAVRVLVGGSSNAFKPPIAHFGLGRTPLPIWARALFADGSIAMTRVETSSQTVVLRDCAETVCR